MLFVKKSIKTSFIPNGLHVQQFSIMLWKAGISVPTSPLKSCNGSFKRYNKTVLAIDTSINQKRFYSSSPKDDPNEIPVNENGDTRMLLEYSENSKQLYKEYEEVLRDLRFKYGPQPNPEILLRTLAVEISAKNKAEKKLTMKLSTLQERLTMKLSTLQERLALQEEQLRRIVPFFSIRNKIEIFELIVAPDLITPAVFKDLNEELSYHEAKWKKIMDRKTDPAVKLLNALFEEFKINKDIGCRRVGTFFSIPSAKFHVPTLRSYKEEQMIRILQNDFEISDPVTLDVVRVLMRL